MHRDHDIYVKAIRDRKKVKLTFFSNEHGDIGDGLFGPIFYSPSAAGDDSDCYYLWDFESGIGDNFLGLPPSQIARMELTKESFDFVEFFTSRGAISGSESGSGEDLPKTKKEESDEVKKVCKNCEYFVQVSSTNKHIWGDCMKAASSIEADGKKELGAFMWADKTCSDFKPREEPQQR